MNGITAYVKQGHSFACDLSLEISADSYLSFQLGLLHLVSYFFFLYQSPFSSLCTVFNSISFTQMRFSQSPNVFAFGDLTSIIRTVLPILVELIEQVNSVIIFLSEMTLLKWLTFLLGSQTVIHTVLLFWIYLFLLTLVFVLQWLSLHWEILIMLLSQFPLTFHQIHNEMPRFIAQLMTILVLIGMVFVII